MTFGVGGGCQRQDLLDFSFGLMGFLPKVAKAGLKVVEGDEIGSLCVELSLASHPAAEKASPALERVLGRLGG